MRIEYHDAMPDEKGKRRFALFWTGYRPDLGKDGPRVQEFHADPAPYLEFFHGLKQVGRHPS